jgi:anthraniloyl-CoA monooxygenase
MRIACVGAGPGGLLLAGLLMRSGAGHEVTVLERNAPDDTFGFGVVFSQETLDNIEAADPDTFAQIAARWRHWSAIDMYVDGRWLRSDGHQFAAMARTELLRILADRATDAGAALRYNAPVTSVGQLCAEYDLVVGADGVNSATRNNHADSFIPDLDVRHCRFMWLGTDLVFEAFKFYIVETPHGVMQIHGYPFDATGSTFIVEMNDEVWRAAGFDAFAAHPFTPGESDDRSIAKIRTLFADILDGHAVHANNSRWINFTTVRNQAWHHGNIVILGDAAHTAHFSIGSGTKLAMEDSLALVACLHEHEGVAQALDAYEAERKPVVVSTQRAAQASLEWFENLGQYTHQDPLQFAFNILSRSRRVTYDNLRLRDPEFVADVDEWFARTVHQQTGVPRDASTPPMFQPLRLRALELQNRVVVSAMDMYSAVDGTPTDFHLVQTGGKALGGAALVMTEMVCVSPVGRITPGCAGMYTPEHEVAWQRVVEFVHEHTAAHIGLQLGHSGRKGSTKLMWEGIDEPLPQGNWEVVAPSPIPYSRSNQTPHELTIAEMDEIRAAFVRAAEAGERAGFDLLELHCAHGYLLSSFISPITNQRTDGYGGTLDHRLRYPLEVFDAVRAVWPADKPMSVRISATDWYDGGVNADDAVEIARAFAAHGADAIDVSTGQVTSDERPAFGRSYQTPFSDRIRNEVGIATIAVGVISSYDDVNSIILAGRADLCALARAHLYDPQWTLHAAADQGYSGPGAIWPDPFKAGSRRPQSGRTDGPKPRLQLIREGVPRTRHSRWRPGKSR